MSAQPLTRLDLNAQAYTELRNWVLTREVGPGEQLNLRTIAETLGVSRSPILHALTRLSAEGLIVTEPRRGFFVKPLTASEVENAHDLRLVLEIFAAERAIPRVTDDDLHGLRLRMNETVVALNAGRRKEYIDVHHEFHRFTVELCANPFVVASYDRLAAHITAARMIAERRGRWTETLEIAGVGRAAVRLVANCDPYTYAGRLPLHVAPAARFELGLDFVAPREVRARDVPRLLAYLVRGRGRLANAHVGHDLDRFEVRCDGPLPLQADGEDLGDVTTCVFEAERDAVDVLV
jgi:DNA-binding GntR family transcriptional regulator